MTNPLNLSALLTPPIASATMRAILDDRSRLQRMLDFEVALARAEAALGIIPALASDQIAAAARAERYDVTTLAEAAVRAGDIAVPLIEALAAEVARTDSTAAGYVNLGAASPDVIDTALVLELRAVIDALTVDLNRAIEGFTALVGRHRRTAAAARTAMQHDMVMPFGLKLAGYAAALDRARERLRRLRREALVVQFGGSVGTLAALNERGLDVAERLAALLDLPLPESSWHSHRDRLAEVAGALAILSGSCGKIARDVSLLMQTEVGEALEPAASVPGGSAALPHRRPPAATATALAAATLAPNLAAAIFAAQAQEHERGVSGWQPEWPAFSALALVASGAVSAVADIAQGLEVDSERMRLNLAATRGQIMAEPAFLALAAKLGRPEARRIVEEASRKASSAKRELQEVLAEDDQVRLSLTVGELAKLFEPMGHQGTAQLMIDRIIGSLRGRGGKR
jgi:3-carboxy-cis,cis-muconate cycloisomerase